MPSFLQAGHFAADADDLLLAGREIVAQVAVVPLAVGLGISMLTLRPMHFADRIAEQPLG